MPLGKLKSPGGSCGQILAVACASGGNQDESPWEAMPDAREKCPMAPGGVPSLVHFTPSLLLLLEVDNRRSEKRCGLREMLTFSEFFFFL